MQTSTLQFLITAKDEASGVLSSISGNATQLGATFTAIGSAITGVLALSLKAAGDAQVALQKFNTTLSNSKGDTQAVNNALISAAKATESLGFKAEDSEQSLAKFFQRTGDVTTAIKLNTVAMDLSRAKNIDLNTAATLVNQVLSGNGRVLKQYGIDLKAAGTPLEALNELHQLTANSAQDFSKTLEGQQQVMETSFNQLEQNIGNALIPVITQLLQKVTPIIEKVIAWTEANPALTQKIVIVTAVIGGLMLILGPLLIALPLIAAGFAILLGPIGAVILIATALGAVAFVVIKNWSSIKDFFVTFWEDIKTLFGNAIDWLMNKLQPFINAVSTVISGAGKVAGLVGGAVSGTISNIGNLITGARASGGSVSSNGTYLVGENGPELFTPQSSGFINPNGGSGSTININIQGAIMTTDAANQMGALIIQQLKRVSRIGV